VIRVTYNALRFEFMKFRYNLLYIIAFLALSGAGLTGCNDKKAAIDNKSQRPVIAMAVKYESTSASRSFVGIVRPQVESDLAFRVSGKVAKRLVQAGDRVKANQELAELDATDLHLQQQQAEAEAKAAASSKTQANAAYERGVSLRKQGWTTTADLDRLKAAFDEASGRATRAKQALSLATNALGYAILLADSDGIVTSTLIEAGQVVSAGAPVIRVAQSGAREVVVAIPEIFIESVSKSQAHVSLWSAKDKSYKAVLRELSPSADSATRTYQAKFTIIDAPPQLELGKIELGKIELGKIELGMTATLILESTNTSKIAKLPLSSLYNAGKGSSLWVVDVKTGALTLKPVEVASYDATSVLIKSGVEAGEMVVTLGVQKLDAGQKVRIVSDVF
jgi:RND family efflux transporter MFP subunit